MKIQNFSLYVHALHSRLQLIRNKLDFGPGMHPSEVVTKNQKYFDKAAESVEAQHHYQCDKWDLYHTAVLLLLSYDPEEREILNQPVWKKEKDIRDWDDAGGGV